MSKFGRRIGTTLAAGALVGEVAAGCSGNDKAFQIDYLKPSVACEDMQIELNGTDAAARTKAIAKGVLACYNMLPKGVFTSTGEANSIHVSFPVAGGEVDFSVLSDAPVEGDPAQYIDRARVASSRARRYTTVHTGATGSRPKRPALRSRCVREFTAHAKTYKQSGCGQEV